MNDTGAETFWRQRAKAVVLRNNAGWWLASFLPALVLVSVIFACALLIFRQIEMVPAGFWPGFAAGVILAAVFAWARAKNQFFTLRDGFTRLDISLGLHNRLTAAAAGIGEFPEKREGGDGLSWRCTRAILPIAGCVALITAAAWIPVSERTVSAAPTAMPAAWAQTEEWLETLEESALADPETVEELREKLEALTEQPAESWYSHSSLEAGDNLRDQTEAGIEAMQRNLETISTALEAMQQIGEGATPGDLEVMQAALDRGIEGLESGALGADRDLLANLKGIDPSTMRSLTPGQLRAMRERMEQGMQTLSEGPDLAGTDASPEGESSGSSGGQVDRGPGTSPLTLSASETDLNSETTEAVRSNSLDRALPGEVVGTVQSDHDVDSVEFNPGLSGGSAQAAGTGGDTVWRNDFTPEEQGILKRFFK